MHSDRSVAPDRSAVKVAIERLAADPASPNEVYFHEDIAGLSEPALRQELRRLHLAALVGGLTPWALERFERIAGELETRAIRRAEAA